MTAALLCSITLCGVPLENFEKGKIIEKVVCKDNKEQSYALYLPPGYSGEKLWPILYAFDPVGRATLPLELFKTAAEKYHYIIVCSNNARNGPWKRIIDAIKALWLDTGKRFGIDYNRIYTAGFSGGARAAAAFPHVVGRPAAGIIACGAGLPSSLKAEQVKPSFYYGIVGLEDFNYKEFVKLGKELSQAGVNHTLDLIDGPHAWPPEEVCVRAVEWMEVDAVKRGIKPKDSNLLDAIFQKTLTIGQSLEASGKIYQAGVYYRSAAVLFDGVKDTSGILKTAARIEKSSGFEAFSREEKLRNKKERDSINRFAFVFSLIRNTNPGELKLKKTLKDLQLDFLLKEAGKKNNVYDSAMAKRLLAELSIKGGSEGSNFLAKGNIKRALIFLEIAARADSTDPIAFYNLACCYSLSNKKKEALKNLSFFAELALKKGYKNFSYIKTDKQLDPLRKEKEFRDILQILGLKTQ
jgi:tetratricopeptide (TPR) repeat protein